jgi:hypothetical protein
MWPTCHCRNILKNYCLTHNFWLIIWCVEANTLNIYLLTFSDNLVEANVWIFLPLKEKDRKSISGSLKIKKDYISRCKLRAGWLFSDCCYFEDKDKTIPSFPNQESPLCTPGLSFLFLSTSSFFYPLIHSSITHGIHSCFQWTSWFWKDGLRVPFLSPPSLISWCFLILFL